mmetsp:Transcript_35611/g.100805  ORF Transcript_35611/g.100805 Transcript_35611/m.100805 type:complete len:322 (+) Transcript_35611:195-1160(+)|eukprot:CAMPEP_0117660514 /NCGR_PEP_ID=MMETSP0804-20121206/7009_1 /TAXON_ID=1074897 /ORGANISM="Tetraselmis astigmatica, Strain CCMP880" /LENGTH=321 /DNA_ID=CAMNT_0005467249 /DNA_START=125 /DNA_END=1090 /DNA_ORIENTATION=-
MLARQLAPPFGHGLPSAACLPRGTGRHCQGHLCRASLINTSQVRGNSREKRVPCVVVPGFLNGASSYKELAHNLRTLGSPVEVVPISKFDWYPTLGGAPFDKLLDKMEDSVLRMHTEHGSLALVCHSAGGFLARILLGSHVYNGRQYGHAPLVSTVVTLGTPHQSLEAYPFGRVPEVRTDEANEDMPEAARGSSLQYANHFYPRGDSFSLTTSMACVAGRCIQGEEISLSGIAGKLLMDPGLLAPTLEKLFAFSSYKANCGRGDVWGDGVTPVECAHLAGAENLVMDGVWHSPGSRGQWYGSLEVAADWSAQLLSARSLRG